MSEPTGYNRFMIPRLRESLSDTPVILVVGPRRAGKTTLVKAVDDGARRYITLDDQTALDAARADPAGFVRGLDRATIDEVQRAPDLLLAIKKSIDEDQRPGRFLLTGSANVLLVPRLSESLAGRIELVTLWPLSQGELSGRVERFIDTAFAPNVVAASTGFDAVIAVPCDDPIAHRWGWVGFQ